MLYVMSDIHGHLQRFESIMDQIKLGEGDHLFVLGDVIDIHPDGIQILQKLFRMPNVTVRVLSIRIEKKVNYFYEVTTSD